MAQNSDRKYLNPDATEFRPQNLPITNPPTFLPAPPVLQDIVTQLNRTIESPQLQQLIETYKGVLTFIASNPETFDQQAECLKNEIFMLPEEDTITKSIKEALVRMNIELAIVEPEYRSQSARVCLCIDSFFEECYAREGYQEYQELSMDYLKKRYLSFGDKIDANPPELLEELVGYAATMADYLTRLQNQDKSVEQLGKAMIEVLSEALTRKFTLENIQTIYEAVKMSCRTLLKFDNLAEKFENFRNILRNTCITDSANMEARKLLLKLLEYISYNEGNRDCMKQTTIDTPNTSSPTTNNNTTIPNNNKTEYIPSDINSDWDDFNSFVPGPEIPVTDVSEWDEFLDEFGKPIESPTDEFDDQYIVGQDLLSPSVARDYETFSSAQFNENKQ